MQINGVKSLILFDRKYFISSRRLESKDEVGGALRRMSIAPFF
jgi:hypothetical protein